MDLPPRQKLALAEVLIESAEAAADPEAEAAWDSEIGDRIHAIDESRIPGVAYEDVRRAAESRLETWTRNGQPAAHSTSSTSSVTCNP